MLNKYRKKRNFNETPEPAGETKKEPLKTIFVVQEHQAKHLHWDFRLLMDGVLKSWAIPKGPPQSPGEKRLAVQVEDHPVKYADFQGKIPSGQYGAGKVKIWDQGTYILKSKSAQVIEFTLRGERLKGEFSLFHPEQFEPKNWLLLKKKNVLQ